VFTLSPEQERRLRAEQTCEVCGDCGHQFAPDEPVWMGYYRHSSGTCFQHPVCLGCRSDKRYGLDAWYEARSCEWCGRPVSFRVPLTQKRHVPEWYAGERVLDTPLERTRTFCSIRCRQREASSHRVAARAEARRRTCPVCGVAFVGTRADAATCSSACRQRAYRQRRREI
jgi:predicted nucleic acid-binding Zn ribbon protein